jgi:PAS domain S-box-containing protein
MSRRAAPVRTEAGGAERFFALSLDLLSVAGFDGFMKRANPAWEQVLGWTEEELTSRPYLELVHPDDRERAMREAARLTRGGGETGEFELRFATRDGGWRWLLFSAQGDVEDRLIYSVGKDITERRIAEAHLAAQHAVEAALLEAEGIEDAAPPLLAGLGGAMGWDAGALWTLDPDTDRLVCVAWWAADPGRAAELERATRELAPARGEGVVGHALASGRTEWSLDGADDARAGAAARAGLHGVVAVPVVSGAGQALGALEFFCARLSEPDARLLAVLSTISSHVGQFVRRRDAERALAVAVAELRRRAAELARSNAELEQFAYVASHDLSEPLRTISGFVKLLAQRYEGQLGPEADEFIGYAVGGTVRMQALIDDLLAYSRVGREGSAEARADGDEALAAARAALAERIMRRGVEVEAQPLPAVRASPRELTQLLQNLLSNAIKFCDASAPRVRVWAEPADDGGWAFTVADNGIGIDPRHAERVFKMFQRLHPRDAYPGTGIGLAICRKIVEGRGGRIWVEPAQGGGSAFRFTLPGTSPE